MEQLNGLNPRHVDQIIRRKMVVKNHGSNRIYNRKKDKDKSFKDQY